MQLFSRHTCFVFIFFVAALFPIPGYTAPQIHTVTPNSTNIAKFEKLELSITLTATFSNPYDYNQIMLKGIFTSPSGQQFIMDGFYFQDYVMTSPNVLQLSGPPGWRVRFSPNETGTWSYIVSVSDVTGSANSESGQFVCTASDRKGFVKKSGNKLVYSNGEPFRALGVNLAFQWWWEGFTAYEDWIDELDQYGGNFTKLSMAPWIFEIEWEQTGVGQYTERQNWAWVLDWVFDHLMEKNMYCQFNVMIQDELRTDSWSGWNVNPYNSLNGGPCNEPQNFFVNETAIALYKRKLRYINARWGYSPQIALWEHIAETDNTQLYNDFYNQTFSWLTLMNSYVEYIDVYNRPISTGYAIAQHDPAYWNNNSTGFTQLHIYDFIPDLEMKIYNLSKWYMDTWNKPLIVGEFGLGHNVDEIILNDPNGLSFHNTLWSSMFSGSATSAMAWYWDNYLYPNGLFEYFQPVSNFFDALDVDVTLMNPSVPLCTADAYQNIIVEPDYNNQNSKAPEAWFHVESSGLQYPTELTMGRFLFGSLYGNRRNPPTFLVNYSTNGQFKVKTGDVALLSKLKIKLDGATIFDQNVGTNGTYSVNIPAGEHSIRVENSSLGMFKVSEYQFHNYAPELRTFAMKNDKDAAGWFQNRKYNWQYVQQNGTPGPISNGKIYFDGMTHGLYEISWFNSNGVLDSTQTTFHTENFLVLNAPEIVWDGAFQVKYISPVIVSFTGTPTNGDAPLSVQFTDQSTNTGANIDAWHWDFGDGSFSAQQNPQHIYASPGNYTVSLQIDAAGYSTSFTRENYITALQALVADFTADTTVSLIQKPIQFTDLSLGSPQSRMWSFGDNSFSFAKHPTHTYQIPGQYNVSLFIQSGERTDIETKTNYILALAPLVADFSMDTSYATTIEEVHFFDLSTGSPESWFWDFGNGATSNLQNPSVIFDQAGTYSVKLIVNTDYLEDSIVKQNLITVFDPLIADFSVNTNEVWLGQKINFYDQSSGNPTQWYWNFGDGNSSTQRYPRYFYSEPGNYTITLEVSNLHQNDIEIRENYVWIKQPLKADFVADKLVVAVNENVHFTDLSLGNPTFWAWDFGDNSNSPGPNPLHKYDAPGEYSVSLHIFKNDSTDVEVKENYIKVLPPLIANFTANKRVAFPGENIQFFDASTGNPTLWIWDLGANNNHNQKNPITSYESPGVYTITLMASNAYLADTVVKENYITIIEALVADFSATPSEGRIGENIEFHDLSSGNPTQWEWWLGNGNVVFDENPVIIYETSGLYDITLIVKNEYSTDTLTKTNYINIIPPYYSQNILLKNGWSGISTYIRPALPEIAQVFDSVEDELYFAINEQGIYSPGLNINTINVWDSDKGLTVLMLEEKLLNIQGYDLVNNNLILKQGWSYLPVCSPCSHPVELFGQTIGSSMKLIKEIGSWHIYWPEMGVSTLDSIRPGNMYQIYLHKDVLFSYPDCN